jgi:hypothetical protein
VWRALGDPSHYVEPFCGSAAVLLARTAHRGRAETINDADGWLINAWRAIRYAPEKIAAFFDGQRVCEPDFNAMRAWLKEHNDPDLIAWLEGHPENYDLKAAIWWLYCAIWSIGTPVAGGPWQTVDGRLRNTGGDGVRREMPALSGMGQGLYSHGPIEPYLQALQARLRDVRITAGDWLRVLTPAVTTPGSGGDCPVGVFLDPPYETSADIYAATSDLSISAKVRQWCIDAPPPPRWRIVLCGYSDEHDELLNYGWTKTVGAATTGGHGGVRVDERERLWLSPTCLPIDQSQEGLF